MNSSRAAASVSGSALIELESIMQDIQRLSARALHLSQRVEDPDLYKIVHVVKSFSHFAADQLHHIERKP